MPRNRPSADGKFSAVWQSRGFPAFLLFPVSLVFCLLAVLRRAAFRVGWLPSHRMPVPVVVIGNLTVGGSGKTPLVIHLAGAMVELGRRPGILTRGYRGSLSGPAGVPPDGSPAMYGDEAVLLARRCGVPVYMGHDRAAAGQALLRAHPECDLLISDDGMQHYRLARDVELAVFDDRGAQNGWCLPAGPLREPLQRLTVCDGIVFNGIGASPAPTFGRPVFRMTLKASVFHALGEPNRQCTADALRGQELHAIAGIGSPGRFFATLAGMGLDFEAHAFPDHHDYCIDDLNFAQGIVLTTEKDAVKLASLGIVTPVWVLPVAAHIDPDLGKFVLEKLDGCSTA